METEKAVLWLYLDARQLKPNPRSINEAIDAELQSLGCVESDIGCLIVDSWLPIEKDSIKLLNKICDRAEKWPVICMQQMDGGLFGHVNDGVFSREFDTLYLWALQRESIRQIVCAYNENHPIGDDDAVTNRIVSDLTVLNLHRTPLNCLTLLKVFESYFDESPVNRSEVIYRVLFQLFNLDSIPTYKVRPDLKDCEFVLGYFCERLIKENLFTFPRDKFLADLNKCCKDQLMDLETQVVFDVLYSNNIIVREGHYFRFRFSYWIYYFAAHRMYKDSQFAEYIFEEQRYLRYPEIIEFYTGVDRKRDYALEVLTRDLKNASAIVKTKCGLPENINPYRFAKWEASPDEQERMQKEIAEGVRTSNLPAAVKHQYADRLYDRARPYDQSIGDFLKDQSFTMMMLSAKAGAKALRNSDYVLPNIKRQLLAEIMNAWEQASKVLFVILPMLVKDGYATYDGAGFVLADDFGTTPQERAVKILCEIPNNVVNWCEDDLFSQKLGTLLIDQLGSKELSDISRHELILLLIQRRPRGWHDEVQRYIAANGKNSYYLFDVFSSLQNQYRFGFASPRMFKDIEHLILMAATKHITGEREPGVNAIKKVKFKESPVPPREGDI